MRLTTPFIRRLPYDSEGQASRESSTAIISSSSRLPKRILFVTGHAHLPELVGGMEVNTHRLAICLKEQGYDVAVHCALLGRGLFGSISRLRRKVLGCTSVTDHGLSYPVTRSWRPEDSIPDVIDRFKPDLCILQGGAKAPFFIDTLSRLSQPFFYYQHNPQPLDRSTIDCHNPFIVANSFFTSSFYPEDRILDIIPPIVDPLLYRTYTDHTHILFVNPAPYKGLDIALDLAYYRPDIPFLFLRQHRKQLRSYPLPPNVHLRGPYADTRKAYSRTGLVLAPSQWDETWGRVISEGQCSGIPALTSDSGGLPEAVRGGGICVPRHAPHATWRSALSAIWDQPAHRQRLSRLSHLNAHRGPCSPNQAVQKLTRAMHRVYESHPR